MNDKILDDALRKWKDGCVPQSGEFPDAADFEKKFFARAAEDETLRAALKKRRMKIFAFAAGFMLTFGVVITAVIEQSALRTTGHQVAANKPQDIPDAVAPPHDRAAVRSNFAAPVSHSSTVSQKAARRLTAPIPAKAARSPRVGNVLFLENSSSGFAAACVADPDSGRPANFDTEEYKSVGERPFLATATNPLSTFGADVDTAGYANLRRMILREERLPPPDSVRLEELINYFGYDYPQPRKGEVLRPHFELGDAPWNPAHRLLLIGVQARVIPKEELPPSHYVFLIDNSGSMTAVFPMVKEAMTALAKQLRSCDRVSMVTYGGGVKVPLENCGDVALLCRKIDALEPGGYTPGGAGIQTAYEIAARHFIKGGNNRIVLVTDGDFNVGASSEAELAAMVEKQRNSGIYLSIAGCGMGNYKDNKVKMLANKGNGNCFYLDSVREAKRAFVYGMTGNMYTLARDVKFQLEFNPDRVFAYRLIGYELRNLEERDFRDDAKDSGEVGIGQQITALYEIIPADAADTVKDAAIPGRKPLKYTTTASKNSGELLTFRMRYRKPQGKDAAVEREVALAAIPAPQANWQWAAGVAEFGMVLRNSKIAPRANADNAFKRLQANLGSDPDGSRTELLLIVKRAMELRSK